MIRPKWERALPLSRTGEADTLVVNLDRLTREPRDLEDAIELVEHYRALVLDISGALDLSTDHGIFLAQMMVAHANLSSRDTSRRIRRAKRADAEAGQPHPGFRAFGYVAGGVTVVGGRGGADQGCVRAAARRGLGVLDRGGLEQPRPAYGPG